MIMTVIMITIVVAIVSIIILLLNLERFKWYRKLIGGKWYYNKYIFKKGAVMYCVWEQNVPIYQEGFIQTVEEESY